jgi:heparanase
MRPSLQTVLSVPLLIGSTFMPSMPTNAQGLNDQAIAIQPSSLPRVGTIEERFQSYNVEMAEIIGGNFWKPYGPGGKIAMPSTTSIGEGVAGLDPNLFQALAPLDTANARLRKLAAALGPAYVRVSGTWANSVYFHDSDAPPPAKAPKGFNGILTRTQWKNAINFSGAANAELVSSFTISTGVRDQNGIWTSDQASKWLAYTKTAGGRIAAAEFFNEPTMPTYGGAPKGYDAAAYARDFAVFRPFVKRVAPDMAIVGPGSVGEATVMTGNGVPGMIRTEDLLAVSPRPAFDIYSYHHYPAVSIRCASQGKATQTTVDAALSERWLGMADKRNRFYVALRDRYESGKPVWITEIADAACGGNPWADTFLDSFRYADTLGRLAKQGVSVLFHNTLASSEYGLLQPESFTPRPNYWMALFWRRMMGTAVLEAGSSREGLHIYAHCLRGHPGGVALLAINNSRTATSAAQIAGPSERYTISADTLQSKSVKLNGKPLQLGANNELPQMAGVSEPAGRVNFAPVTITFLAVSTAGNARCNAQ